MGLYEQAGDGTQSRRLRHFLLATRDLRDPASLPVDPANLDTLAEVTAALRALGFTSSEATTAARAAVTHVGRGAPWDELMRVSLALSRETG